MRVVLDTNCLIMAISSRNRYNIIWKSFLVGDYMHGTGDRSVSRGGNGGPQADCFGETAIIHTL